MLFAGAAAAAVPLDESTSVARAMERSTLIGSIVNRFQADKDWSPRYLQKLNALSDARLGIADRATSFQELDSVLVEAPFASGTGLGALRANRPGNVSFMAGKDASVSKASPGGNPTSYDDLVFTAVAPCRIYDSRFSTAPVDGSLPGAMWPANTNRTVAVGPYPGGYAFQGGQATACLGGLGGTSEVAAIMGSVSTVSQTGQGFLVFFSAGSPNPSPYGVVQYYQPGYVQTSFVVMTTDLIDPVWTQGYSGQASTHVIVDVVGYFARPKAVALDCTIVNGTDVPIAAGATANAAAPACAAGYTKVTDFCRTTSFGTVVAGFNQPSDGGYCNFSNPTAGPVTVRHDVQCCRTAGRP
jgi:hypothetical protein